MNSIQDMAVSLPSMNALRAFEAAARLQSFARAAEEICLTDSAISHQIKALEEQVGAPLFVRTGRRMMPTETGRQLMVTVREALALLGGAFVDAQRGQQRISLALLPSFAARWFAQRMKGFLEQHPEIVIELLPSMRPVNLADERVDAAIRFGLGGWNDVESIRLGGEWIQPVCTPAFAHQFKPEEIADIASLPLIENASNRWSHWFEQMKISAPSLRIVATVNDSALALDLAEAGVGVALGRTRLIGDKFENGHLMSLVESPMEMRQSYYLLWRGQSEKSHRIEMLAAWLTTEFGREIPGGK